MAHVRPRIYDGGVSEAMVRALERAYDDAWTAGDLDAVMACFADGAIVVNPRGEACEGTSAIRRMLGAFLDAEARGSVHRSRIERVAFVREDVAVTDGRAILTFADGHRLEHPFTDVVDRATGRWLIAHTRAYAS
jgi:uncharacterized protein (TIGR02246 family)